MIPSPGAQSEAGREGGGHVRSGARVLAESEGRPPAAPALAAPGNSGPVLPSVLNS